MLNVVPSLSTNVKTNTFFLLIFPVSFCFSCCLRPGANSICFTSTEARCNESSTFVYDESQVCGGPSCCVDPSQWPNCEYKVRAKVAHFFDVEKERERERSRMDTLH